MLKLSYKKMAEVIVRNDYYLLVENSAEKWPADFTIQDDLEIFPSLRCQNLLKKYRMQFVSTNTGFQLFIQQDENRTFVPIKEKTKWVFFLRLRKANWMNFTNQRLITSKKRVFYFSNRKGVLRTDNAVNPPEERLYLGEALPAFGKTYFKETAYSLGDLVRQPADGNILEAVVNGIDPTKPFNSAQWFDTGFSALHYVNPQDSVLLQGTTFLYERDNITPDETITFTLKDENNKDVELGNIPNTDQKQSIFKAPSKAQDPVHHALSFEHLSPGVYTLSISSSQNDPDYTFYYVNALETENVYGVIEFFSSGTDDAFALLDLTTEPGKSIIQEKLFQIRFKNRLTKWQYLKQDNTQELLTDYRPLRKQFSASNDNPPKPDPDVSLIFPTRAGDQITEVRSKIYVAK
jgi:hypothetical protein